MLFNELSEFEQMAQRNAAKRQHLLSSSPSILTSLSQLLAKKEQATQSLEDAEREEARLLELQRHYNRLLSEKADLVGQVERAENYAPDLEHGIRGWQQVILDYLFAHEAHALDKSGHAAGQITLLRARLEVLPTAMKALRARLGAVKAEIAAIEKKL